MIDVDVGAMTTVDEISVKCESVPRRRLGVLKASIRFRSHN